MGWGVRDGRGPGGGLDPGSLALTCIAGHRHLREVGAEDSIVKVAGLWGEGG